LGASEIILLRKDSYGPRKQNIKLYNIEYTAKLLKCELKFGNPLQRNEPCSLPVTVEMIAAYLNKTPEEVALATTFNALKVFGLSA
jgi:Tat protein secretion system quality control protein TatD with DNase activity